MSFVNLPVADVERSRTFFTNLGYTFNEKFCDGRTLALVLGEDQFAMLTQTDFLDSFHPIDTTDASKAKECVLCLSADSREAVDALVDRAIAAGGTAGDTEDHGFMYGRSYDDPDGHSWQIFWMAHEAAEVGPEQYAAVIVSVHHETLPGQCRGDVFVAPDVFTHAMYQHGGTLGRRAVGSVPPKPD
jgi:predicted lactoylglutathione lyase